MFLTDPLFLKMPKSQRKNNASKFIALIKDYLQDKLHLSPKTEYKLGNHAWSSKADIAIELGKNKFFVEVEEGQNHPDTNVTKYWSWIEKEKISNKVILIQIFGSDFYDNNYRSRTELCKFIADKIKETGFDFIYIPIPEERQHKYNENWQIFDLLDQTKRKIKEIVDI